MAYALNELRPLNPSIDFGDYSMEFELISLHLNTKICSKYLTISNAIDTITNDPDKIYEVAFILVKDKNKFPSLKDFKKFFNTVTMGTADITMNLTRCFHESIMASMPLIKNKKMHDEYNNAMGNEKKEACYGVYYDTIAKRYSYTLDQFMCLTLRQLHIILTVSNDAGYEELEVQAALLGRQLKPRMKMVDIDEKVDAEQDAAAAAMLKQKQKEYQDKLNGK